MLLDLINLLKNQLTKERQQFLYLQILIVTLALSEIGFVLIFGDLLVWVTSENGSIIGEILSQNSRFDEITILLILVFALILINIISLIASWRIALIPNRIGAFVVSRLYNYYLSQETDFFEEHRSAQLISKLTQETGRLVNQILHPITQMLSGVTVGAVLVLYLIHRYSYVVLLILFFFILFYSLFYAIINNFLKLQGSEITLRNTRAISYMEDGFWGFVDFKTTNTLAYIKDLFQVNAFEFGKAAGKIKAINILPKYTLETLVIFLAIILISYFKSI